MRTLWHTLFALCVFTHCASALPVWKSSAIGGGGWVQRVIISPTMPSRLYTYVDIAGIFRSDDGGKHWRMIHVDLPHGQVRDVIVDPRNPDNLLAAIGTKKAADGIYRSTNGGITWAQVAQAPFVGNDSPPARDAGRVLIRQKTRPDSIYAISRRGGLLVSHDNGITWELTPQLKHVHGRDILIHKNNPALMWVCGYHHKKHGGGGLFHSKNAGKTWQRLLEQGPSEMVQIPGSATGLIGLFDTAPVVRISTDGGKQWDAMTSGLVTAHRPKDPVSDGRYAALAVAGDTILLASMRGTFYRLKAGDATWEPIGRGTPHQGNWLYARENTPPGGFDWFGASLSSITVHPKRPNHWFFTDWAGIYETIDGGQHWHLRVDGLETTVTHTLAVHPKQTTVIMAGMADIGCLRSTDGGTSFKAIQLPNGLSNTRHIRFAPSDKQRVYASAGKHWHASHLLRSNDSGQTFSVLPMAGLPDSHAYAFNNIALSSSQADELYVTVSGPVGPKQGGVYRSLDGGAQWKWHGQGLPTGQTAFIKGIWGAGTAIAIDTQGSLVAISDPLKHIYRREKNSRQWSRVKHAIPLDNFAVLKASPHRPSEFYLSSRRAGLWRSQDGGATWQNLLDHGVSGVALDSHLPGAIIVTDTSTKTRRQSLDHGQTWRRLPGDTLKGPHGLPLIKAGKRIIAGSHCNGIFYYTQE